MIQKVIKIPIYNCTLTVVVDQDLKVVGETFGITADLSGFKAFAAREKDKYQHYIIALSSDDRANVVHEIIHAMNFMYVDLGIELDRYNDESQAYLAGYLFKKINKFLNKNK